MIREKWVINMKKADFEAASKEFNISPIVARLLRNRDLITFGQMHKYLNSNIRYLNDPILMKDMDKAIELIAETITGHKKIRIIGDYDIDGVNAVYILLKGLRRCGGIVDYDIPDRCTDGYGINIALIDKAIDDGIDTIITCDNGISAYDEIAYAKSKGITVIVTDHHSLSVIPEADAVIDPHRPDCDYPFKELCGASVAWKLIGALYKIADIPKNEWLEFIENAAIATVGDVVDLIDENRIIVKEGLKALEHTSNKGLRALMDLCGVMGKVTPYHVGFVIGPCINAGGRLDSAKKVIELLLCDDDFEAIQKADELIALNESRKAMTSEGVKEAIHIIEGDSSTEDFMPEDRVIVLYLPKYHESLAGIIAGRLKEKYFRPVIVFTDCVSGNETEDGSMLIRGSGRSVPSYDMFANLSNFSDLFEKFGGHPMAAGMTIKKDNFDKLCTVLNESCGLCDDDLCPKVELDMELPFAYATPLLTKELDLLEPYGKGNRKPLFALRDVEIIKVRIMGRNNNVAGLDLKDPSGNYIEGIYFAGDREFEFVPGERMNIAYYPKLNDYKGIVTVQAMIQNYIKKS